MSLLGGAGDDGAEGLAEGGELSLGGRVEEGKVGNVHRVVRVVGVENDGSTDGGSLAVVADANLAKEILGVSQVCILLGAAKTLATLGGSLILVILAEEAFRFTSTSTLGLVLGNTLGLGLLVGGGFGISLGLGLSSLLCLLALYLGVFGGIPGIEDLERGESRSANASLVLISTNKQEGRFF